MITVYYAEISDFSNTESFLRYIILKYYHLNNVILQRTNNGKPYIENVLFNFSVAHSKNCIAAAFMDNNEEIGFDLEYLGRTGDYSSLVKRFPLDEQMEITDMQTLSLHWTIRESYIKFKGETLAENFTKLSYYGGILYKDNQPLSYTFQSGKINNDYIYTICTTKQDKIQLIEIQGETQS